MSKPPSDKKRNWRHLALIAAGVLVMAATAFWLWLPVYGLNTAKRFLRWRFNDIPQVTTSELGEQLKSTNAPILLDIRARDEFEMSHIPNARHLSPEATDAQVRAHLATIPTSRPIVVYCSVGYRSCTMARRLKKLGRKNVSNLEGSIFAWATESRTLESSQTVHPYNWFGNRMLPEFPSAK